MLRKLHRREDGAVLPIMAVYLLVGVGMLALAVDLGHIFLVKSELQRTADSAALAGALRLMTPNTGVTSGVMLVSPDCTRAIAACQAVGMQNKTDTELTPVANIAVSWVPGMALPSQIRAVPVPPW